MKTDDPRPRPIIELVTDIVVAYVASNSVRAGEVTRMIGAIHAALAKCGAAADPQPGSSVFMVSKRLLDLRQ
jgi:predicted transcriptional regulator